MDDAERFVREAMAFERRGRRTRPKPVLYRLKRTAQSAIHRLARLFRPGFPADPYAYASVPNRPIQPRLRGSVRLPLP